ncbi:MAG: DUF4143 domain-containing protein [archaeon]|nr:DUF4143 domain-containing protein [archaeon]
MNRIPDDELKLYLEAFGAVCVEGPKGCGKTWFSLNASESAFMVADPKGMFNNRKMARIDPILAFEGAAPHLIDEWQDVPEIWDTTKFKVDENQEMGRYILTGSSTPHTKGIYHTGAARIGVLRIRTMSLYESGDSDGAVSIMDLFQNKMQAKITGEVSLDRLIHLTVRGGWPALINHTTQAAEIAVKGYVERLIDDAVSLDGKTRNKAKMTRVLRSLARNESTLAKTASIVSDSLEEKNDGSSEYNNTMQLSVNTVKEYLDVLDRLFVIENQFAYEPDLKSSLRVGKLPKRHLTDPSLSLAVLGLTAQNLKSNLHMFGYYFEALCERDLAIYAKAHRGRLYHYRDHNNREIDAIMELSDGSWGAFEIKLGTDEIDDAADNLLKILDSWRNKGLRNEPAFLCVISGMSNSAYRREDGVFVVPITSLKD